MLSMWPVCMGVLRLWAKRGPGKDRRASLAHAGLLSYGGRSPGVHDSLTACAPCQSFACTGLCRPWCLRLVARAAGSWCVGFAAASSARHRVRVARRALQIRVHRLQLQQG